MARKDSGFFSHGTLLLDARNRSTLNVLSWRHYGRVGDPRMREAEGDYFADTILTTYYVYVHEIYFKENYLYIFMYNNTIQNSVAHIAESEVLRQTL